MKSSPATSFVFPWIAVFISVIVNVVICDNFVILDRDSLENNLIDNNEIVDNTVNETTVTIPLTTTNVFSEQNDSSARHAIGISDHAKKLILPFLMGITLKVMTFIPIHVAVFFLMGSVALFASKSALMMALLAAYISYKTKKHKKRLNSMDDMNYTKSLDDWYKMKFMKLMMSHPMSNFQSYYKPYTADWYKSVYPGHKVILRRVALDGEGTNTFYTRDR